MRIPFVLSSLLLIAFSSLLFACVSQPTTPDQLQTIPPSPTTNLPSPTPILPNTPTPLPPPPFRIIGYVTDDVIPELVPYDKLTHINYAFVIPNADGTFQDVNNPWKLKLIVEKAHEHGVQVLVSVGGWGWDAQFEELASDPQIRAVFVAGLVDYAKKYNLDGLDIDWEYPDPGSSAQNFLALMQELRNTLPQGKLLTAAVVAQGDTGEGILAETFPLMDFINIMAYDGSETDHSPYSYAQSSLDYWNQRGLPAEKTVLGVPFYARPNWIPYRKLIEADPAAANLDVFEYFGQNVYYNSVITMQQKTKLAMEQGSGVMIWTLTYDTYDDTSLLTAIYTTIYQP